MSGYSRRMPEILFRSRDGDELFAREADGRLTPLPAGPATTWQGDERHRALAESLDRFGLWDHLGAEERAAARHDVATGCYPLDPEVLYDRVQFHADGEAIAEGGVARFLADLEPGLSPLGLAPVVATIVDGPGGYVVEIEGVRCTVVAAGDWDAGVDVWAQATVRPLAVVNGLLADRTPVRAHTLYAGRNDGFVLLIQPGVAAAMRASGLFPEQEIPALAQLASE